MNDPHVEALHYEFISEAETQVFDRAAPLSLSLGDFDLDLKDEELVAKPKVHYSDEAAARADLEPHLRAWEESAVLDSFSIRFKFRNAEVVDRTPRPGVTTVYPGPAVARAVAPSVTAIVRYHRYPEPHFTFASSALTTKLTNRLREFRKGRERLCSIGYAVLSAIHDHFGDRDAVVTSLRVEKEVLNVLGDLTAVDDPEHGRKSKPEKTRSVALQSRNPKDPFTHNERTWIEDAVSVLIRRLGEYNAAPLRLSTLTMRDFPPL